MMGWAGDAPFRNFPSASALGLSLSNGFFFEHWSLFRPSKFGFSSLPIGETNTQPALSDVEWDWQTSDLES